MNKYTSEVDVALQCDDDGPFIHLYLGPGEGGIISIGDKISFRGSHVIIRDRDSFMPYTYSYEVYQAIRMSAEEQERINRHMYNAYANIEDDYEADYESDYDYGDAY